MSSYVGSILVQKKKKLHGSTTAVLGAVPQRAVMVNTEQQGWL